MDQFDQFIALFPENPSLLTSDAVTTFPNVPLDEDSEYYPVTWCVVAYVPFLFFVLFPLSHSLSFFFDR